MRIAFRADASLRIGTGHVMRCLTLADALKGRGASCHFICRAHPGHLGELIARRGHTLHLLPLVTEDDPSSADAELPPHAAWLGSSWSADAAQTASILAELRPAWLITDHYALDARWETLMRAHCERRMIIDDLADRAHDCDLLLDQNLGRTAADYEPLVPAHCTVLAGPRYALLRPEFAALREYSLARRKQPRLEQLLVTMGGVDQPNATEQVLRALADCPLPQGCRIVVVMGPHAPWIQSVRDAAASMPRPTVVLVGVDNMAQLMADSDLAIGAAGSTSWERACLALPTIQVVLANNQTDVAKFLEAMGAAWTMDLNRTAPFQLATVVLEIVTNPGSLSSMAQSAASIADGAGTSIVSQNLIP